MDDFYAIRDSILRYAQEQFGAEPDHPWARYPGNIVLRHSNNSKWYALFMDVPMSKTSWISVLLDGTLPEEEILTLLNLSYDLTRGTNRKGAPGL